ncbi:MAG TPA: hypothetical protein VLV76_22070 [Candidatus Acidoferrum sp.]|nr:hypothetical protein [Candidatus Acidoferrum sp.]
MENTLHHIEQEIAATWKHIDRQRHVIEVLREHGHAQDVPTAEVLLQTLTASLEVLCERKEILLRDSQQRPAGAGVKPALRWISK